VSESGENFNMNHLTTGRIKPKFGLNLKYQLLGTLLIIGLAVYFIISTITFINKCELVKAKITDVKFEKGYGDDNDKYTLSIFIPSKNSSISGLEFDTGFTDPEFEAGQIIELYYDKKDPNNSEIKSLWKQWAIPLVMGLALMIDLIFIVVFYMIFSKFRTKTERDAIISE
jgi:hypothetical protein